MMLLLHFYVSECGLATVQLSLKECDLSFNFYNVAQLLRLELLFHFLKQIPFLLKLLLDLSHTTV
jgi:hypothetical protein